MSRSFVIARAVAADQWLRQHDETSLERAPPEALQRYLETLEPALRLRTWRALTRWGDEMMLRGIIDHNPARALEFEIDLRDDAPAAPAAHAERPARRTAKQKRTR